MNKVIMSIDAGGTKTKAALIDYDCNIVFERVGGPGSPAVLKEQKAMKNTIPEMKNTTGKINSRKASELEDRV